MSHNENLLNQALLLPPTERANLVDLLLASLDKPDEAMDELWRKEIRSRIASYESGRLETVPIDEVVKKYSK